MGATILVKKYMRICKPGRLRGLSRCIIRLGSEGLLMAARSVVW